MATEAARVAARRDDQAFSSDGSRVLDELMTARQIADMLQMPVSTIEDYARRRVLPSIKLGRHRRFIRSQVEQAIYGMAETPVRRLGGRRGSHRG